MFILTGGGSGIGKALAQALAKRGKTVLIVGRRLSALQETAKSSSLIQYLCADVSTEEGLHAIKTYVEPLPHIEALVNNAGTLEPIAAIKDLSPSAWHQAFSTNVDAALFLPQLLYSQLSQNLKAKGRVLNIGSGAANIAIQGWSAYCVSKAALAMLTRCWQMESEAVAFANVKPGIVDTPMQDLARKGLATDPMQTDFYISLKQKQLLITPETLAEFLIWLLLDTDAITYSSQEWDIYDTSHHIHWLKPPHQVLHWEE